MRRRIGICLLAAALSLAGCGGPDDAVQRALDMRTDLLGAGSCTFSAEVSADLGDRVCAFTLDCAYSAPDDSATLTVTAPDTLAGIRASVTGEGARVAFEDTRLELGTPPGGGPAPLELPRILGGAWASGYIESESELPEGFLATYRTGYGEEELLVCTWFNEQGVPTEAEVYDGGTRVLSAELTGFSAGLAEPSGTE